MFLYRGSGGGDLFYSVYKNGKYSNPSPFVFNTMHKESSLTMSPDGNELIFAREVNGKSDLYISSINSST